MSGINLTEGFAHIERLLDVTAKRHTVLADNLVNMHVPGYTRRDVQFEEELAEQLDRGFDLRTAMGRTRVIEDEDTSRPRRNDGNNVELEYETGEMNKNKILSDLYYAFMNMRISQMRLAIQGR